MAEGISQGLRVQITVLRDNGDVISEMVFNASDRSTYVGTTVPIRGIDAQGKYDFVGYSFVPRINRGGLVEESLPC